MLFRALSILLLLASSVFAGWPDNRIVHLEDGGTGSFVQVGNCVMILSCAHRTIDTSISQGERIPYKCGDDSKGTATVIALYPFDINSRPFRDAAIYSIDRPPPKGVRPFTVTGRETPPNAKVWVVGFPAPQQQFSSRVAQVVGYDGMLLLTGESIPGESGGPIINEYGELVGTLTGNINGRTYCCPANVIGNLLKEVETTWIRSNCQDGQCGNAQPSQWGPPIRYQELPPPPQPINPQLVPVQPVPKPTEPAIDQNANCEKLEVQIQLLKEQVTALKKQIDGYKECQCGNVDVKISTAIAGIKFPSQEKPQPVDIKQVASEVQKNLPPMYMRVDPRSEYQSVRPGQYVTLPLDKVKVQ